MFHVPCSMNLMLSNLKKIVKESKSDIIILIIIILISLLSFAIGYIMAKYQEKEPIEINNISSQLIGKNPYE